MRNTYLKIRFIIAVALGSFSLALTAPNAEAKNLVGQWTFEAGEELKDKTGNFGDLFLGNGATIIRTWHRTIRILASICTYSSQSDWSQSERLQHQNHRIGKRHLCQQ